MPTQLPFRSVLTGASGFVGRRLGVAAGSTPERLKLSGDDWQARLAAVAWRDAVVFHLAARVHEPGNEDLAVFERDNTEKTRALAQAAGQGGARRLVFVSTIKVNGEDSSAGPFRSDDAAKPAGAYATSKWRAELALAEVARATGLEVAVVRAPLVMGPGAAGNLAALMALADSPWPLPFASIENGRAMIDVDDLVRLLLTCAAHPAAPGRTWLCAGPRPVSTPALVSALRAALRRPRRLFRMPAGSLVTLASLGGQGERMRRLVESLEVDDAATSRDLGWRAQIALEASAAKMAQHWRAR
ncbi:NAD-dependent epimerase/dehydratase family protein [Usitatibacter palustris]|uniref:NAD-dependent epimerase/dehydratase domain-containing protein n=1 Tax=Usitatibacter palustris TaxID=2732487 RepID=A0A6M4HAT7_9PROT|nr:NAD-dependent epimerase/dehydratase family protein [Usitatibacter palustris]QJR16919.1 hypothetical protein DSM104440_03756 [Usitatibacter palustris]